MAPRDTSRVGGGTAQRYAVVSCHVERLLDDRVWERYRSLLARRPSGFAIASLVRPPDPAFGEDEALWLARVHEASAFGPLGHHTHWTAPDHARPVADGTGERVRAEGQRLRSLGLRPLLFCGGGWYTDAAVAEACAALGYVDCTPRSERPAYLDDGAAWAELDAPARVRLPSGGMLAALPTTRSLGSLGRSVWTRRGPTEPVVHVYFHDTDLVDARRRVLLRTLLAILARRRRPASPLDLPGPVSESSWDSIARGKPVAG
jgi:hypothetical protein